MGTKEEQSAYMRAWYAANRERVKRRAAEWKANNRERARASNRQSAKRMYERNPEKYRRRSSDWRAAQPERVRAKFREWYAANLDEQRARSREYQRAHPEKRRKPPPEKRRAAKAIRRARQIAATVVPFSEAEWLNVVARYGGLCAYCRVRPWEHRDHVVPLSRGGAHAIGNIVPACARCNQRKGAQTWTPVTLE